MHKGYDDEVMLTVQRQKCVKFQAITSSFVAFLQPKAFSRVIVLSFVLVLLLAVNGCDRWSTRPRSEHDGARQSIAADGINPTPLVGESAKVLDVPNGLLPQPLLADDHGDLAANVDSEELGSVDSVELPSSSDEIIDVELLADDAKAMPSQRSKAISALVFRPVEVGENPRRDVERVFQQHAAALSACHDGEAFLAKLDGRFVVTFTVEGDGSVSNADVASTTLHHKGIEKCVTRVISSWRFIAHRNRVPFEVSHPFIFERGVYKPAVL